MKKLILASSSPRRRELLGQIGLEFEIRTADVDEHVAASSPEELVRKLSHLKASAIRPEAGEAPVTVLGADTIVAVDGTVLGKPADPEDAKRMLRLLQGRSHEVYTGVTLLSYLTDGSCTCNTFAEETKVFFAPMTEAEIETYVATGDPLDKAGAYGIQGFCARYITHIEGDYNNVVGLPVGRVYRELKKERAWDAEF
ncbi:MAG: Maf family protein [Lachnospiraceae bacterium]|nr:Maf family protein [Lachnospiraceae bacterium]